MRWERIHLQPQEAQQEEEGALLLHNGPGKRWGHTCNSIKQGRLLYLFGGYGPLNSQTNQVHVFDTLTLTWSQPVMRGTPPTPRDSHSCTAVGENLFVFGGTDGANPLMDLHVLDTSSHTWVSPTLRGEGPEAREGHSAAVVGKRLFVFGGCGRSANNEEVYYNDLYILNTETFVWKKAITSGRPPSPRDSHTCSSLKNNVIVIGGEDMHDYYLSDVHILDADMLVWREVNTSGQLLPPRGGHSTVAFGKNLFVFGGFTDAQTLYNDLYMLDVDTGIWTKVITTGDEPSARFSVAGDCLDPAKNGVLVFVSGCNKSLEGLDDMYYLNTGLVRESERRLEKLSFRKQLQSNYQEQNLTPTHERALVPVGADNFQHMTVPFYGQPGEQVYPLNQSPAANKLFRAKVTESLIDGCTIETVIDGKPLRGVLFSNKSEFCTPLATNSTRKRVTSEVDGIMSNGNCNSKSIDSKEAIDLRHQVNAQAQESTSEMIANIQVSADPLQPVDPMIIGETLNLSSVGLGNDRTEEACRREDTSNGSPTDIDIKRDKQECLDEYGRLVREGSSDSNSDASRNTKRPKTSTTPSRNRPSRSPRWSTRNRRSRSRSPTFRDEIKRQDRRNISECFDFRRGRCSRGGSCRYMHSEPDRNDVPFRHRNHQKHVQVQSRVRLHGEIEGQEIKNYPDMVSKDGQFDNTEKNDQILSSADIMMSQGGLSQAIEQSQSNNSVGLAQKFDYPSRQIEASVVSDSPLDQASKTSLSKVSSTEAAAVSTQAHPTGISNAQQLSSGQFSSQVLAPPLPSFSSANSPYPSQLLPPPPQSQGISVAHVPQLHINYSQRPPYPVQSMPTGLVHPYQSSNQLPQFSAQDSVRPFLSPPPLRPPYDPSLNAGTAAQGASSRFQQNHLAPRSDFGSQSSMRPYGFYPSESSNQMYPTLSEQNVNLSHSLTQGHLQPQPVVPPSQDLARIKMQNFSADNFPSGELVNASSQIHPQSHNQQPSYGFGDSMMGMPAGHQLPQVPDFGASRIQTHHNPYAATFDQPLSFKLNSNVQVPVDGQGVGSAGSRQTTSSPTSADDREENRAAGEVEIDQVKSRGKSKKNNDSRSGRLFKSAVADFVKDLLKPSWRQGNMSKEAFKTIVKKSVDKVSGAMKSHQIPKSEAKINHYIDSSQRKLTKLVMGYVDKYVKV